MSENSKAAADKYDVADAVSDLLDQVPDDRLGFILAGVDSEDDASIILETLHGAFRLRVSRLREATAAWKELA